MVHLHLEILNSMIKFFALTCEPIIVDGGKGCDDCQCEDGADETACHILDDKHADDDCYENVNVICEIGIHFFEVDEFFLKLTSKRVDELTSF